MTTKTLYIGKIPAVLYTPSIKTDIVVVFFHGRGESGNGEVESKDGLTKLLNNGNHKNLLTYAEKYGFSVLAPQYVPQLAGWSPGWTNDYVEQCIDYALTLTSLQKVGVTGLSQGGGGTWISLTNPKTAPKIFGAIAICPTPEYNGDFSLIAKYGIPVQNFHAADDKTVGVASSKNMVGKANAYNPNPKVIYEEFATGGHGIWGTVYGWEQVYPKFLAGVPKEVPPVSEPVDEILTVYKTTVFKSGKVVLEEITK